MGVMPESLLAFSEIIHLLNNYLISPGSTILQNSQQLMEPEGLLLFSQEPANRLNIIR
jgi:hypothetical protein